MAMSIGHSKSKVSNQVLNDRRALRVTMLKSIATDLGHLFHEQRVHAAEERSTASRDAGDAAAIANRAAALEEALRGRSEYLEQFVAESAAHVDRFYADFEQDAFTWLVSDNPSLEALSRDVIDVLRALRVADALRQRGTTLKTSGGYQIFVDQNTANAVFALQKSSGELMLFESDKTHSIGEANIGSSELDLGGNLRISFNRGSFRTEAATSRAANCCAMIIGDIQQDVLDSFWRPDAPSSLRKHSDGIQILIEETDDNIHFATLVLEELCAITPELSRRSRVVPSLKNISAEDRQRYLTAAELNWALEQRRSVIAQVAQSGHKTERIDPELAFTDVRLIGLHQGEVLLHAGAPPGFVYVPMGDGLQSLPSGGYQRQDVQSWIPLGNTSVIRGDVQEARVTAEKDIRLLMIPKEIYLKHWHDTYNLAEFAPTLDRLYAEDEHHRKDRLLGILKQLVMVDGTLDDSELVLIQHFLEALGEAAEADAIRAEFLGGSPTDFSALRQDAVDYLASAPPYMQVARLRDLLNLLVEGDGSISAAKRLVLGELNGLLVEYLDHDKSAIPYQILVVPQSAEQDSAIATLLPGASRIETGFGFAYLCGTYHSSDYAEMIRDRYRSLQLFAVVVHGAESEAAEPGQTGEVEFTPDELEMYANFIHRLTPPEFTKLVRAGQWELAEADHVLLSEGHLVDRILFIGKGQAAVTSKGEALHGIEAGSFVGEMEFLAGGPAFATVTAVSPMSFLSWQRDALEELLAVNPEMQSTMQAMFSTDVVRKLHLRAGSGVQSVGGGSGEGRDDLTRSVDR
jgi:hypothetical protein